MFTFLDPRVWLLALALAGVSGGLGYLKGRSDGHKLGSAEVQQRWDAIEAKRREVATKAEQESRAKERALQEKANAAIATANQRAIRDRAAADLARSELDGLRVQLATIGTRDSGSTEATCKAPDDRAPAVAAVLGECATALEDLARKADGHARDALTLHDAWPN